MIEVRHTDGRLACKVDESTKTVEIQGKGCVTLVIFRDDGSVEVINVKQLVYTVICNVRRPSERQDRAPYKRRSPAVFLFRGS